MARKKKSARWVVWTQAALVALRVPSAVLALWLLGQLESYLWFGALVGELGFHLAIATALAALVCLVQHRFVTAVGLALVAVLFTLPLVPLYQATKPTPQYGPLLRVATSHLAGAALTEAALESWLARERPDALALTGLRDDTIASASFGSYRATRGTGSLRSLLLVQNALVVPGKDLKNELPTAFVRAGRCQARIVTIELSPLASHGTLDARRRQIAAASDLPSPPRSVWLGQLGSRAEAHDLRGLFKAHSLRDARIGHGRLATGPAALGPLGFPLEHVLVHGWISVRDVAVAPALVPEAQLTVTAQLELTEPRCRFSRDAAHE